MPFGLRTTLSFGGSLINPEELREDVQDLYYKYEHLLARFEPEESDVKGNERRFYVYVWFTKDEHKIFYVGKGTESRYRHIISDMAKPKGYQYKELQDSFGIEFKKIADNLTNIEASIYEFCMIQEYTDRGEVLLQFVDMPYDREKEDAYREAYINRTLTPMIKASDYDKRYFGIQDIYEFDTIEEESLLKTHFYGLSLQDDIRLSAEIEELNKYIVSLGGRVYSTLAKGAKSVIEFRIMNYRDYEYLHKNGYKVYHSSQVLKHIKDNPSKGTFVEKPKRANVPKYDSVEKEKMVDYLKSIQPDIPRLAKEFKNDGYLLEQEAFNYEDVHDYKSAIMYYEASAFTNFDAPAVYERLAIIYRKFGMFEDELRIVSKASSLIDEGHAAFFIDRKKKVLKILEAVLQ